MTTDPTQARDGATTALHRELERYREAEAERPRVLLIQDIAAANLRIEELTAELERVKDQCNRQEHGFAQRESALQTDLATERAAREQLADAVGQALVACALGPGENLSSPNGHAIVSAVLELKETVRANQHCADREYKRRQQAERERDTALAQVKELEAAMAPERAVAYEQMSESLKASETALASARGAIAEWEALPVSYDAGEISNRALGTLTFIRTLLTSHPSPAPVEAPCAGDEE